MKRKRKRKRGTLLAFDYPMMMTSLTRTLLLVVGLQREALLGLALRHHPGGALSSR
jgi:hypothetical protein